MTTLIKVYNGVSLSMPHHLANVLPSLFKQEQGNKARLKKSFNLTLCEQFIDSDKMRRRDLLEEFQPFSDASSPNSPSKKTQTLLEDFEESSDFVEHKKNTKKKSSSKKVVSSGHNRTTSSSSSNTGSNVSFGYGKHHHKRTQSSTSSNGSSTPVSAGGYQSSLFDEGDNTGYSTSSSTVQPASHIQPQNKYQGFGSREISKPSTPTGVSSPSIYSSNTNNYGSNDSHIGVMKDNYYEIARKQQAEDSSNYFLQVISDMLKYIYTSISSTAMVGTTKLTNAVGGMRGRSGSDPKAGGEFPQPEIYLDPHQKQLLDQFKKQCSKKFDIENEKHQKLLVILYKNCTQKKTTLLHGEHWKFLGFQNTKPESDFRGAGILGLNNLLYFAKNYKKRFRSYFNKCTAQMELSEDGTFTSYPFVIAGLNVTMMLFDILGWGIQSNKCHNIVARKNFIELITTDKGKPAIEEEEGEDDDDSTPSSAPTKEGTLLSFDDFPTDTNNKGADFSPLQWDNASLSWDDQKQAISNSKKQKGNLSVVVPSPKKKVAAIPKKRPDYNIDLFHEMYVVGFTCLHREWYRTKSTYFEFGRVLTNSRKHVEDLLEMRFNNFADVKEFNNSLKQ